MGWVSLFGCLTTAYGPALVLFLMLVAPKAQLFMVFILRFVPRQASFMLMNLKKPF